MSDTGTRVMKFSWYGDGEDGEHNSVGFMWMSYILATQGSFSYDTLPCDRVHNYMLKWWTNV